MNSTSALTKNTMAFFMARHPSRTLARDVARAEHGAALWSRAMTDPAATVTRATRARRVLVLGASGLVGGAHFAALRARGHDVVGTHASRPRPGLLLFDFKQHSNLAELVRGREVVVMASAMTHVDRCETHPQDAHERNVDDVRRVAEACEREGAGLISFSTDYVFDGNAGPYAEDALVRPLSVYGRSKLEGELV